MTQWIALKFNLLATSLFMTIVLALAFVGGQAMPLRQGLAPTVVGRGWLRDTCLGLLAVAVFVLPVPAYWLSAHTHPNAIAGLLPWADGLVYFYCADEIVTGTPIEVICRMRPFYSGFFATIFEISGRDLQLALLIQAAVIGGGAYLLLREVGRQLSAAAQLAVFSALFLFAAEFCDALVLTENAGLLLGTIGIAILWRDAGTITPRAFFVAMFFLAVGQNARGGAFLILPTLLAWAYFIKERPVPERRSLAGAGALGIAAGFLTTFALIWIYGGTGDTFQSNFSYILYGLTKGGATSYQIHIDHPEFFADVPEELELTRRIYGAAFANVIAEPHLLLFGYAKGLVQYFGHLFNFVRFMPLRAVFIVLWVAGLAAAWRDRRAARAAMLLWIAVGVFLSSPALTFNGGNRLYAVTFPADAILAGLGIAALEGLIARRWPQGSSDVGVALTPSRALPIAGLFAIVAAFAAPLAARFGEASAPVKSAACPPEQESVIVHAGRETPILSLVREGNERIYPLAVSAEDFARRFDRWTFDPESLRQAPGTSFVWGFRMPVWRCPSVERVLPDNGTLRPAD